MICVLRLYSCITIKGGKAKRIKEEEEEEGEEERWKDLDFMRGGQERNKQNINEFHEK